MSVKSPHLASASFRSLSGETDDNILWKSSKTDVAKVSSDGLVTAKAKGTTVISATLDKTTVKLQVNVTK